MAKPAPPRPIDEPRHTIVLDGRTPIRLSLGTWPLGARRSAYVAISRTADAATPVHPTLGAICLASDTGELTLSVDPVSAQTHLAALAGERLWVVAACTAYERALAGTAWAPVPVRVATV